MEGQGDQVKLPTIGKRPLERVVRPVGQAAKKTREDTTAAWAPPVAEATENVANYQPGTLGRQKAESTLEISRILETTGISAGRQHPTEKAPTSQAVVKTEDADATRPKDRQRGFRRFTRTAGLVATSIIVAGCQFFGISLPIGNSSAPSSEPSGGIVEPSPSGGMPSESAGISEPPSASPNASASQPASQSPEASASAETQKQLEQAVKDWLNGTTKTPEPLTIGTNKLPFHIGQAATYIENTKNDPDGMCSYTVDLLGEQTINNHLEIYGGIQNDDNVRHVLIFNLGKMQEKLELETFASNNLKDNSTWGFFQLPDAITVLAKYNGKAIQIYASIGLFDTATLQKLDYDAEINSGVPTTAAIAQWQANTAWKGSKETKPPANVDIDKVLTSFDITKLSQSKNIMLPALQ